MENRKRRAVIVLAASAGILAGIIAFAVCYMTGDTSGKTGTPWIGLDVRDVDSAIAKAFELHSEKGVLVNKVKDVEDFKDSHKEMMDSHGVKLLGLVPYMTELTHITVDYLAKSIFAKVITGENGLDNKVKNVFVGAMSAETAIRNPLFKKDNKLIITPGDRHDMIIAALETDTAGIVLTCNFLPDPKVIAKASEKGIPLLLMPQDTFKVAKMIDDMEPLLAMADSKRIGVIERLIKDNVDLKAILG